MPHLQTEDAYAIFNGYYSTQHYSQSHQGIIENPKFLSKAQWQCFKPCSLFNPLSANLPTNCLSVFDHFVGLALNGLEQSEHKDKGF